MGITARTALGIVALLALANAPATMVVSSLTHLMPEAVATEIAALAPVGAAAAAGRPVARPEQVSRAEDGPGLDKDDVVRPAVSRQTGDLACLAEAVYFEARGTGTAGERAVAHVVVNRSNAKAFPGSVCGVVHDGCQFSYRCDGRSDVLADKTARARAYQVAQAVLDGAPDITNGALYFHSAKAKGGFGGRKKLGVFGGNVFYR
ncbi:MAG: cell wall hydrolase [Amaricoccus sp.]|uniref:cell wall hydrolase n=1 Tax=Amaricoccus sp. TaxID=1872485 RepID=UPI0039E580AC